jgi:hypothetical protein
MVEQAFGRTARSSEGSINGRASVWPDGALERGGAHQWSSKRLAGLPGCTHSARLICNVRYSDMNRSEQVVLIAILLLDIEDSEIINSQSIHDETLCSLRDAQQLEAAGELRGPRTG